MANIEGTSGNDKIGLASVSSGVTGGPTTNAADLVWGELGKDTIQSGGGDDEVYGESGQKVIRVELAREVPFDTPADRIDLGDGNDKGVGDLYSMGLGHAGADRIDGGAGDDTLYGDADKTNDTNAGDDRLTGGLGTDAIYGDAYDSTDGVSGNDTITGDEGDDQLYGDASSLTGGGGGSDKIDGGDGDDQVIGDAATFTSRLVGETLFSTLGGDDTLHGGDGNDSIVGDAILGGSQNIGGNDKLYGDDGDDTLYGDFVLADQGNGGDDILNGGNGDDFLDGGQGIHGDDLLIGGKGADTFAYGTAGGHDTIKDYKPLEGDTISFGALFDTVKALDANNDGILGAGDDGVTASGKKMVIDPGFGTADAGVNTLTIIGVHELVINVN